MKLSKLRQEGGDGINCPQEHHYPQQKLKGNDLVVILFISAMVSMSLDYQILVICPTMHALCREHVFSEHLLFIFAMEFLGFSIPQI